MNCANYKVPGMEKHRNYFIYDQFGHVTLRNKDYIRREFQRFSVSVITITGAQQLLTSSTRSPNSKHQFYLHQINLDSPH